MTCNVTSAQELQDPAHSSQSGSMGLLQRFRRHRGGAAAVEFAMVAVPFFGLLGSIFEISIDFYISAALQTALNDSARDILTGQAQSANYATAQDFIDNSLCGLGTIKRRLPDFINCSRIQIDVRPSTTFSGNDLSKPVSNGVLNTSSWGYNPGTSSQVVIVRAIYTVPIITALFGTPNSVVISGSSWHQRAEPVILQRLINNPYVHRLIRRLGRDVEAVAAVEFTLILPVMLLTYLGAGEIANVLAADRRVVTLARALSDLTAQYSTVADTDIGSILAVAGPVMMPFATVQPKLTLSSVVFNTNPTAGADPIALVDWTVTLNGGTARACTPALTVISNSTKATATTIPRGVAIAGTTIIVADVTYAYAPMFGSFIIPGGAINLKQSTYMLPRSATRITYTGTSYTNCNANFTG
eukprot:gene10622-10693_t